MSLLVRRFGGGYEVGSVGLSRRSTGIVTIIGQKVSKFLFSYVEVTKNKSHSNPYLALAAFAAPKSHIQAVFDCKISLHKHTHTLTCIFSNPF